METEDIKRVVIDQKKDIENCLGNDRLIEREFLRNYKGHKKSKLIKVILGARRCGKSTLACQLLQKEKPAYINFDDERLAPLETNDLNRVLESFYEVYREFNFILLDEAQNVYGWELFVNRLQRQGFNVIVTGSNAKLLSRELATHLTGRHTPLELFPFSFKEYLEYYGVKFNLKLLSTKDRGILKRSFNDFIQKGGFPEALKEDVRPDSYLRSLYSSIVDKDVILRKKIKYATTLKDISNYLISNCSCQISFNKIKNIFNLRSIHTALNYVSYLEEAYLFFFLKRLSYKQKESLVANRKIYAIDTGLVHALSLKLSHDNGRLYENVVALQLLRKKALDGISIYYWQDVYKHEVDFVVQQGLGIRQLIQVCYDPSDIKTKDRELKSLLKASKELKCRNLLVITGDKEGEETIEHTKIRYIPLWKWLLE